MPHEVGTLGSLATIISDQLGWPASDTEAALLASGRNLREVINPYDVPLIVLLTTVTEAASTDIYIAEFRHSHSMTAGTPRVADAQAHHLVRALTRESSLFGEVMAAACSAAAFPGGLLAGASLSMEWGEQMGRAVATLNFKASSSEVVTLYFAGFESVEDPSNGSRSGVFGRLSAPAVAAIAHELLCASARSNFEQIPTLENIPIATKTLH